MLVLAYAYLFFRSPLGDTSGYYIPSDYPKHLGLDTEFQITGSKEPYVMAEFSNKDDLNYLGNQAV